MMSLALFFESEGGKIATVLFMMLTLLVVSMILHMTGHDPAETGRTLLAQTFTGLFLLFVDLIRRKLFPPTEAK